jgi:hypothetical protein
MSWTPPQSVLGTLKASVEWSLGPFEVKPIEKEFTIAAAPPAKTPRRSARRTR